VGANDPRRVRDHATVHPARQADIRDQEIHALAGLQDPQSLWAVFRFQHPVARFLEHVDDQHPDGRFVVDDQNRLAMGGVERMVGGGGFIRFRFSDETSPACSPTPGWMFRNSRRR
jgi:hypothetical protein